LSGPTYRFTARLWQHSSPDGWHFLTLPEDLAAEIREIASGHQRPFGTVATTVTIGSATWSTSLFADRKLGSYVLPVKAEARRSAGLVAGDDVECRIELAD
jgi:Domain of unknown function (DUF1905)